MGLPLQAWSRELPLAPPALQNRLAFWLQVLGQPRSLEPKELGLALPTRQQVLERQRLSVLLPLA